MRSTKPMRHWIGLTEGEAVVEEAGGAVVTIDQTKRDAFYGGTLSEKRQAALDALDRVLGHQSSDKMANVAVLREIAADATRMADGIEQRARDRR